ncbi:hypothetical protein GEMRC1_003632 [Eukaryota sp. GEM-RC1]
MAPFFNATKQSFSIPSANAPPRYPVSGSYPDQSTYPTIPSPSPPSHSIRVGSYDGQKSNDSPLITGTPLLHHSFKQAKDDDCETIKEDIVEQLKYFLGRTTSSIDNFSAFMSTAFSVRSRLVDRWNCTQNAILSKKFKCANYLSLEWLQGRALTNALINLNLKNKYSEVLESLGVSLEQIATNEPDAGLGNGGLGRLSSCFIDSLATTNYPCWGYGLRYSYGMFKQLIEDGEQVEVPEYWLNYGSDHVERIDVQIPVRFGGHVVQKEENGRITFDWQGGSIVRAIAYDAFIPGFKTDNVLNLRLWAAKAPTAFDLTAFKHGDYFSSVREQMEAETLTSVLYPDDSTIQGRQLRLKQQYFFTCATITDILNRFDQLGRPLIELPEFHCVQLNDTHPVLAIPELMRQLMDIKELGWDEAWDITQRFFFYTNHTLMAEALERWPVPFFELLFPRHLQIIYHINHLHLSNVREHYTQQGMAKLEVDAKLKEFSIIEEGTPKNVRMAFLAVVSSVKVNGVAQIHAELVKKTIFNQFVELYGEQKFVGITNGVTFRRWLKVANPPLCDLIHTELGTDNFLLNPELLRQLERVADDDVFQSKWKRAHLTAKRKLVQLIKRTVGISVNENALFDTQIKRIHEYKRQFMNILHVIHRYLEIKKNPTAAQHNMVPRVHIYSGKAASSYVQAKRIIKLICAVANVINNDPQVGDLLKVVFLPSYGVSLAETIIPGSDISEQISTATTEASGTSNFKFALNGCLTIGTEDGANIEIAEHVGKEHMFIFGYDCDQVAGARQMVAEGRAPPMDKRLVNVIESINSGTFGEGFQPLVDSLYGTNDFYLVSQDFTAYCDTHLKVDAKWRDKPEWIRSSIINTAKIGHFSSDRSVREYADMWNLAPCPVKMNLPKRGRPSSSGATVEQNDLCDEEDQFN